MSRTMTGGCQCRRICYSADVDESAEAYLCHCRMCQRATGGVSIAFLNLKKVAVRWETPPDIYQSSPIARRPFCSACGTPLGFEFPDSENIDLTIGSFDDPRGFVPTHHSGAEALHEAWIDTGDLPRYRTEDSAAIVDRWKKAIGRLPD
ncbi:GFA family protein [bacterium]|nr:MAG: GFA family protein [bacterium]